MTLSYALGAPLGLLATVLAFDSAPNTVSGAFQAIVGVPRALSGIEQACSEVNMREMLARALSVESSLGLPLA